MKKSLFILLLLICASVHPVSAEAPVSDIDAVIEKVPAENQNSAVQPDKKTLKEIEKEHKKTLKKAQKEYKKAKKAAKKAQKQVKKAGKTSLAEKQTSSQLVNTYQPATIDDNFLELEECLKLAVENHPAIQSAIGSAEIFKSKIAQAWSNYFPVLTAGISYSRNDVQASNIVPAVQRYNMYYVPTISAQMLLFDFGKTKSEADIAKRNWEASKYALENSINNVIYNVKQSYYNLLFAQQQVKVYEDTVHDFIMHLEQAKEYYHIGKKPKIDVLTAEYNLGRAKLNLIQAKNTLKTAYVQLSNAMGMPELTGYEIADRVSDSPYDITMEKAAETAYETNPELLAAKKRSDASEVLIRVSKTAFTPDISAFASYSSGGRKIDSDHGWQFGGQIMYQSVNLLLLKKQVDEAKAQYKKDFADYLNVKQNVYYEIKQAYLNMITAEESINVAKLSMEQAREQYDSASGRYKAGLGDAVELKDAETTFRNSQLDYYKTLLNYEVSAANLECLMGVPLEKSDAEKL